MSRLMMTSRKPSAHVEVRYWCADRVTAARFVQVESPLVNQLFQQLAQLLCHFGKIRAGLSYRLNPFGDPKYRRHWSIGLLAAYVPIGCVLRRL